MEEFALGESFVHRLDPRSKILAALVFSVVVTVETSITASLTALAFPILLLILAHIGWRKVLTRLALVNAFIVFLWVFLPFTVKGEVVAAIGPLEATREGLLRAALITVKSNAVVLAVIALLGTSPVFNLVHALSHMHVPDKLVHLFFFCFRYVHVIHDEYGRLVETLKIRAFRPGTNVHTYRTYAYVVGMLLVRSYDRSQRILAAMKCRGFNGKFYILHHYEMKRTDYLVFASSIVFSAALLVIR